MRIAIHFFPGLLNTEKWPAVIVAAIATGRVTYFSVDISLYILRGKGTLKDDWVLMTLPGQLDAAWSVECPWEMRMMTTNAMGVVFARTARGASTGSEEEGRKKTATAYQAS